MQTESSSFFKIKDWFRKAELEEELHIDLKKRKQEEIQSDIDERQSIIGEIESVILDVSVLDDAKTKLQEFYQGQSELKSTFESESEERDVESLSKKEGFMFLHGVSTKNKGMKNTSMNNPSLDSQGMGTEEKLSLLMGLEPTISASIIKEGQEDSKSFYTFGVILGGGKVLSAYKEDAGTLAESMYSRRSKYDNQTTESSIQPDIENNLDEAMDSSTKKSWKGDYNEAVVENPQVAGLYINVSQITEYDGLSLEEIRQSSHELNLPVYAVKGGMIYPFDVDERIEAGENNFNINGDPLTLEQVVENKRSIRDEEKIALASSVIDKKPFSSNNNPDFHLFGVFFRGNHTQFSGKGGYEELLRAQGHHKIMVKADAESRDPGTAGGVLKHMKERLIEQQKNVDNSETSKFKIFHKNDMKDSLMATYGFALGAKEKGDEDVFELAKRIINEFGSFDEYKDLISKRLGEDKKFKVLDTDVPIEVRNKMEEYTDKLG